MRHSSPHRTRPAPVHLFVATALLAGLGAPAPAAAQESADALVARLLDQVGGAQVWAAARGFHMLEILHSETASLPVIREYWVDFEEPRIMESSRTNGMRQTQALNRDRGWTERNGEVTDWEPATVDGWAGFWPGIPTRVFHLLASEDPSVQVRLRDGNRLDVLVDGAFAVWIATTDEGVPVAYGREETHTYTHFLGRMEQYGPVRLWAAAYEPGDLWEVVMVDYSLIQGDMPVSYDGPANGAAGSPGPA